MKKSGEYVSRGTPPPSRAWPAEAPPEGLPRRLTSDLPPNLLPRDHGMAGAFGAYEVRRLARLIPECLRRLEAIPENAALAAVDAMLDRLLPSDERARVTAESLDHGRLTLVLARRSDGFVYGRTLVPRLRVALESTLGRLSVALRIAPREGGR